MKIILQHQFFVEKVKISSGSYADWSKNEDKIVNDKMIPLILEKDRVDWKNIYNELKDKLPGRTFAGVRMRWENYLNPLWESGVVGSSEEEVILKNFQVHGFKFSRYNHRRRSVGFLRKFISMHIETLHMKNSNESICAFFYGKLLEMMGNGKESVLKKDWLANCSSNDQPLEIAYLYLIHYKKNYLSELYGIVCLGELVSINHGAIYPAMAKRKRFSITPSDKAYLEQLIEKYQKMNQALTPVIIFEIFCYQNSEQKNFLASIFHYKFLFNYRSDAQRKV